jgi:hypothetical protein
MKPLTVILSFALLSASALGLYLLKDFMGPLAIAAAVLVLILVFLRR